MDYQSTKSAKRSKPDVRWTQFVIDGQRRPKMLAGMNNIELERVQGRVKITLVDSSDGNDSDTIEAIYVEADKIFQELEAAKKAPTARVTVATKGRVVTLDQKSLQGPVGTGTKYDLDYIAEDPENYPPMTRSHSGSMVSVMQYSVMNSSFALMIPVEQAYPDRTNTGKKKQKTLEQVTVQVKDTGWISFDSGRTPRKSNGKVISLQTVMDNSAHGYAQAHGDSSIHVMSAGWEWLHLLGRQLGGQNIMSNLVAGTCAANSAMIPIENAVKQYLKKNRGPIKYRVTVNLYKQTHIGAGIIQQVEIPGKAPRSFPESGALSAHRREEFTNMEAAWVNHLIANYLNINQDELSNDVAALVAEDSQEDDD